MPHALWPAPTEPHILTDIHTGSVDITGSPDLREVGTCRGAAVGIRRDHIERAAQRAGIRPDEIDAQVASLSAHLGWDITRGAKQSG